MVPYQDNVSQGLELCNLYITFSFWFFPGDSDGTKGILLVMLIPVGVVVAIIIIVVAIVCYCCQLWKKTGM